MPRIETTVWFEVYCGECGADMCHLTRVVNSEMIKVRPCEKCLKKKYHEGTSSQKESSNAPDRKPRS